MSRESGGVIPDCRDDRRHRARWVLLAGVVVRRAEAGRLTSMHAVDPVDLGRQIREIGVSRGERVGYVQNVESGCSHRNLHRKGQHEQRIATPRSVCVVGYEEATARPEVRALHPIRQAAAPNRRGSPIASGPRVAESNGPTGTSAVQNRFGVVMARHRQLMGRSPLECIHARPHHCFAQSYRAAPRSRSIPTRRSSRTSSSSRSISSPPSCASSRPSTPFAAVAWLAPTIDDGRDLDAIEHEPALRFAVGEELPALDVLLDAVERRRLTTRPFLTAP